MPLQFLPVPPGYNQFFSAYSLAMLLPVLDDDKKLDTALKCLFDHLYPKALIRLIPELEAYSTTSFPASLEEIINTNLRPKLADYILLNQATYATLFESQEALLMNIKAIREGQPSLAALEYAAMAAMTQTVLQVYRDVQCTDLFAKYQPVNITQVNQTLQFLHSNMVHQCAIDPAILPEKIRQHLFPMDRPLRERLTNPMDRKQYNRIKLQFFLQDTLSKVPQQLIILSASAGSRPISDNLDPFRSQNLTNQHSLMRFDAIR